MVRPRDGVGRFVELGVFRPVAFLSRPVRAYLPPSYDPSVASPLLLMFDGQNAFGDEGSFAGGWHAHEAVNRLAVSQTSIAPIVVALENGGRARTHEMGSEVRGFVSEVATTLVSRLEAIFNLQPASGRAILGASLGGLAALLAHFEHPEAFGTAIAMSPSLWFARRRYMEMLAQVDIPSRSRVYIDAGMRENGRMFLDAHDLGRNLIGRGHPNVMWRPDSKGTHHERHWRRRLPKSLRFAFPRPKAG